MHKIFDGCKDPSPGRIYLNEQAVALADGVLEMDGLLTGSSRAEVLLKEAARLGLLGRRELEEAALEEAVALAEKDGEPGLRSRVHRAFGTCRLNQSRYESARKALLISRDLAIETGDRKMEGSATGALGLVFYSLGKPEEARGLFEHSLAIAGEIGDRLCEARTTGHLGLVLLFLGQHEEARKKFERNLAIATEIGNRVSEGLATVNLGVVFESLGLYREARERHELSLAINREIGNRLAAGISLVNLGLLHARLGAFEKANVQLDEALRILREIGARREEGYALHGLAEAAEAAGEIERAKRLCEQALLLRREIDYRSGLAQSLVLLGRIGLAEERHDEARASAMEAHAIGKELNAPGTVVLASALLALLPGTETAGALDTLEEHESRIRHADRMEARFLHFRATTDRTHLEEAHRLLCHLRDHAPGEHQETMIENVRLHRDIMAAWGEHRGQD